MLSTVIVTEVTTRNANLWEKHKDVSFTLLPVKACDDASVYK